MIGNPAKIPVSETDSIPFSTPGMNSLGIEPPFIFHTSPEDVDQILNLLNFIFEGDQKKSLENLKEMIKEGLEPSQFLNDLPHVLIFLNDDMHQQ